MPDSFPVRYMSLCLAILVTASPLDWASAEPPSAVLAPSTPMPSTTAAPSSFHIADVALAERGLLTGHVLDPASRAKPDAEVTVYCDGHPVVTTRTDTRGAFAVAGLRGGVHHVATGESAITCRLWASGTAPPAAVTAINLVDAPSTVRGQWGPPPVTNNFIKKAKVMATNPFVVGGVVAAAVAVPVALHNADEDDGPSS